MSKFKVIEIVDSITIKVAPDWVLAVTGDTPDLSGNKIIVKGLVVPFGEESKVISRLNTLLLNKEVDLLNPLIISHEGDGFVEPPSVSCNVFLDSTDVTYYFPEYKGGVPHLV